ncbi:MAG: redoxin domain-containing protein [Planctomycetota bacterium]
MRYRFQPLWLVLGCLAVTICWPAISLADEAPPLPRDPAVWINSPPISLEQLRGKGVFLWFYEETCPNCRAKWPTMLAKAAEFKDQPIVFMAVNSGNPPAAVREYARIVNSPWPMLADVDRNIEKAYDVGNISLKNITQHAYITHDGKLHQANWSDPDGTIKKALEGAAWKIDPKEIPPELKDAWLAVEFGNFKSAGLVLKKLASSQKREIQDGTKKIQDFVQAELTTQFDATKQARDAGEHWKAYELCMLISDRYNGFELPEELADIKKELLKESQVKAGVILRKALDSTIKVVASGRPVSKKAKLQLEKIISDYPETKMSKDAEEVLKQGDKAK